MCVLFTFIHIQALREARIQQETEDRMKIETQMAAKEAAKQKQLERQRENAEKVWGACNIYIYIYIYKKMISIAYLYF